MPENITTDTTVDDRIDAAILDRLPADGSLVSWAKLRRGLPGNNDQRGEAFVRLLLANRIAAIKINGRNHLGLIGEREREMLAEAAQRRRVAALAAGHGPVYVASCGRPRPIMRVIE